MRTVRNTQGGGHGETHARYEMCARRSSREREGEEWTKILKTMAPANKYFSTRLVGVHERILAVNLGLREYSLRVRATQVHMICEPAK